MRSTAFNSTKNGVDLADLILWPTLFIYKLPRSHINSFFMRQQAKHLYYGTCEDRYISLETFYGKAYEMSCLY